MNVRLCLAIGLPTVAFRVNVAVGIVQTSGIQAHLASFENNMNAWFERLESRFARLELRFSKP